MDAQGTPENKAASPPRRSSSGLMPGFDGLHQQKRQGDMNAARRQSMTDQSPKAGFLSQFFHNNFGRNSTK